MTDIAAMSDEALLEEYESVVWFRAVESHNGQVSPKEIALKRALEEELLTRLAERHASD
ncbi:hypothetical protein [Halobellus clavatus]|jgi:hypothetical protein|uniref:Uncharacterized protein n=1 Tax=Halobellus clavatus TaxID=660517 RepID=A0A1H3D7F0_9EURY|nr:hypothetical protein [Halobellus clavatus]SDX62315.1 hypothetical protein SAMN04487946_101408 [Halobellus clavatus]